MNHYIFVPMFRKITATLLMLAFVSQTFARPFIMLDYFMNTAAYAENCVNKAMPKMHCNGKCQAMKKIQEEEKKEQQNAERKSETKIPVLSSRSSFCKIPYPVITILEATVFEKVCPLTDISYSFFHPPKA
jgi:hypothetical protein